MIKPFEGDRLLMRVDEMIGDSVNSHARVKSLGVGPR
jgi:hypothetical protein